MELLRQLASPALVGYIEHELVMGNLEWVGTEVLVSAAAGPVLRVFPESRTFELVADYFGLLAY